MAIIKEKFEVRKELIIGMFENGEVYGDKYDVNKIFNFLKKYSTGLEKNDHGRLDVIIKINGFMIIADGFNKDNEYIQFHLYVNKNGYVYRLAN